MRLLVSACLMGLRTRYDGQHSLSQGVLALSGRHVLVPVCPEQLGGLPTPRPPCEIIRGRVMNLVGRDCTEAFVKGAEQAMAVFRLCGCQAAVLKQNSHSCGKSFIHDGGFAGRLIPGRGILAARLIERGVPVYGEDELHLLTGTKPPLFRP